MIAFFAIMPSSARMPRIATKPSGRLKASSASTTPMMPSGSSASTSPSRRKEPSWNISSVTMSSSIIGTTAMTEAWL